MLIQGKVKSSFKLIENNKDQSSVTEGFYSSYSVLDDQRNHKNKYQHKNRAKHENDALSDVNDKKTN